MMKYRMFFLIASAFMIIIAVVLFFSSSSEENGKTITTYIAKRELSSGGKFNSNDYTVKEINTLHADDYVTDFKDYDRSYIYKNNISSGIALKKSYLEKDLDNDYSIVIKEETTADSLPMMLPNRLFDESFMKETLMENTKNLYAIRVIFKFPDMRVISRQISKEVRIIKFLDDGVVISMPSEQVLELQTALHEDSFVSLSIFSVKHSINQSKTVLGSDASFNVMELKGSYE